MMLNASGKLVMTDHGRASDGREDFKEAFRMEKKYVTKSSAGRETKQRGLVRQESRFQLKVGQEGTLDC